MAKHRALDRLRHAAMQAHRHDEIGADLLRLVFTACHPARSTATRVALTLRLIGGLGTDAIARAAALTRNERERTLLLERAARQTDA